MKKSDIAMIIFIASISVLVAYVAASTLFGSLSNDAAKVKTIAPIDATLVEPRSDIFNKNAINPAVQVQITGTSAASTTTAGTQ
jgi:mannitol-specific phosphotransferase system IIBC component